VTAPRGRGEHGERGGATVLAVACLGLVLVVAVALAEVGAWFATERRVRAAADLAALAAAAEVLTDPCGSAVVVAHANGAELEACEVTGREVVVTTSIPAPSRWGPEAVLTARARAGPA
jgi:secretion/DNA translocation related TadE-like protein